EGRRDPLIPAHQVHSGVGPDIASVLNRAMALNPDARCGCAEQFRGALLRRGYSRWAVANECALALPPQSVSTANVSMTVGIKAKRIVFDNVFNNNSVFDVEKPDWLLPEPSRAPAFAVAIFAFMLLSFIGVRYDFAERLLGLGDAAADEAKQESVLAASDKPLDRRKTYRATGRAFKKGIVAGMSHESSRRNDKSRR